jgi:PKD repeat protein
MKQTFIALSIFSMFVFIFSCSKKEETFPAPVSDFTYTLSDSVAPVTVTFTNTSTNATGYVWSFGHNDAQSTQANPQYTYPAAGSYTVSLLASGKGGSVTRNKVIVIP